MEGVEASTQSNRTSRKDSQGRSPQEGIKKPNKTEQHFEIILKVKREGNLEEDEDAGGADSGGK